MSSNKTTKVKMLGKGSTYQIKETHYEALESLIEHARESMTSPIAIHFISHIHDAEQFKESKRNFIKNFERGLKRQFKGSKQNCPEVLIAYSVEFKYTTQKEIDSSDGVYKRGNSVWEKTKEQLPFLHLHMHVIADCNKTYPTTFKNKAIETLNCIDGLRASRYSTSCYGDLYKKVKTDYADVFQRLLYIGKIEQKSSMIPYKKTFGTSKIPKKVCA